MSTNFGDRTVVIVGFRIEDSTVWNLDEILKYCFVLVFSNSIYVIVATCAIGTVRTSSLIFYFEIKFLIDIDGTCLSTGYSEK